MYLPVTMSQRSCRRPLLFTFTTTSENRTVLSPAISSECTGGKKEENKVQIEAVLMVPPQQSDGPNGA